MHADCVCMHVCVLSMYTCMCIMHVCMYAYFVCMYGDQRHVCVFCMYVLCVFCMYACVFCMYFAYIFLYVCIYAYFVCMHGDERREERPWRTDTQTHRYTVHLSSAFGLLERRKIHLAQSFCNCRIARELFFGGGGGSCVPHRQRHTYIHIMSPICTVPTCGVGPQGGRAV